MKKGEVLFPYFILLKNKRIRMNALPHFVIYITLEQIFSVK
jgi:hypothetical protein